MEHLDPQVREIYTQVGLAMSLAQSIEGQLAVVLTCASESLGTRCTPEEYDSELAAWLKRSFGRLVTEFCSSINAPREMAERLRECATTRNWMAHRYLHERSSEFQSSQGQHNMIQELDRVTDRFDDLQEYFIQLMARWARSGVLTRETLAECIREQDA